MGGVTRIEEEKCRDGRDVFLRGDTDIRIMTIRKPCILACQYDVVSKIKEIFRTHRHPQNTLSICSLLPLER